MRDTKPSGSITLYYTFVDHQTKEILESTIEEAENFFDFVVKLGAKACNPTAPSNLVHIAAVLAFEIREERTLEDIAIIHGNRLLVRPWTFPIRSRGDRLSVQDKIEISIEKALQREIETWVRMELLILKAYALILKPEGSAALDAAKKLLDENLNLRCFAPYIHHIEARILWQEGSIEEAISGCDDGIEIAEEINHEFELARLLAWRGIATAGFDSMLAQEYHERAYRIYSKLGSKWHMNSTLLEMAEISIDLGEYDLALEYHRTAAQIYKPQEGPDIQNAQVISQLNSDIGDAEEALTWAEWAYNKHLDVGSEGDVFCLCTLAWPLIQLGRLDEAEGIIDSARSLMLKSGYESDIAFCNFVTGLYESASGNPEAAMHTLKEALAIYKKTHNQVFITRTLLALAETEIVTIDEPKKLIDRADDPFWLGQLRKHVIDNRLPGIQMKYALIKSDFLDMYGRYEEARAILVDALGLTDSPGVRSLEEIIRDKIKQLDEIDLLK